MTLSSSEQIEIVVTRPARKQSASSIGSGQVRLNNGLAVALAIFLAFVPIPLGGNRPFFWAANATVIGFIGLVYAVFLMSAREPWRIPLARHKSLVSLWLLTLAFLFVQALPLGTWLGGFSYTTLGGATFSTPTISLAPGATLLMALRLLTYGVFFYLVLQAAANRQRAANLANAVFFIICGHALYGILALTQLGDPLLIFEKWAYHGSATGTFVNRNSYATLLAFGLVMGLVLSLKNIFAEDVERGRNDHLASAALFMTGSLLIAATLFATQSRMGLFAGLVGATVSILIVGAKMRVKRPGGFQFALGLTVVLAVFALLLYGSGTVERLGSVERDFDIRYRFYQQIVGMISQHPWLGYGGGSFELAFPLVHTWPVSPDQVFDRAHSTYLALWSELGVVFGSLYLVMIAIIVATCGAYVVRRKQDWWLPVIVLGATTTGAVHSLVDFSLEMQANAFFFLAILGLGFSNFSRRDRT